MSGYDVFRLPAGPAAGSDPFTGDTFDGDCLTGAVPQGLPGSMLGTADAELPQPGAAFFYQVGHSSTNPAALAALGVRDGRLVLAGTTCP